MTPQGSTTPDLRLSQAPDTHAGSGLSGDRQPRRTLAGQQERERGSSAIELVLVTPVLIALLFGLVQTALVWNARHVVGAAAQHGARLARSSTALTPAVTNATSATGSGNAGTLSRADMTGVRSSTLAFLRQTGGGGLQDPTVTVTPAGDGDVVVTVSGTTVGVLPGTTSRVRGSSRTPVEGFHR